ncbi:DBP [Chrysodeixis includens nucleopolyhedrovirus]|uniref:DBP n=1 Tax=Chrysodeixis includens nucleopolyhedrovirus TaxID=1207438 RepID=A0A5B8YR55_9ABAC|nr:DBP [Chrysodeixis includens nucleopolyhedrovirus]QED40549.1 DBP [Chrysodeixis includens nucleopolyhedrovirus]
MEPIRDQEEEFVNDDNNSLCLVVPPNNMELVTFNETPDEYEQQEDKQLRRFRKRKYGLGWLSSFIYNLKNNEHSVVECINNPASKLETQLIFTSTCLDIDECGDRMFVQDSPYIATKAPAPNRSVTTVGQYLKGGLKLFYFFDIVSMRRGSGKFGEFIMLKWKNMQKHLDYYAKVVSHKYKTEGAVINNTSFINVPAEGTSQKIAFVKKFYEISFNNNRMVFSTDEINKVISCEEMSVERFNELLYLGKATTDGVGHISDTECNFLMGAIIEGYKASKNENLYTTLDGKNNSDFSFSLAVVPQVLFYINSENYGAKTIKVAKPECIIQESP